MEEVFGSVSDVQASGLNPPPARTVLTPRSAEACLKHEFDQWLQGTHSENYEAENGRPESYYNNGYGDG